MSSTTEAKKPQPARGSAPEKLVVELRGPRNEYVHFPPVGDKLFGGFRKEPLQGQACRSGDAFQYPDVPGCRIEVNYKLRCGIVVDSLGLRENQELLGKVNGVRDRFNKPKLIPFLNIVRDLDDTGLATWTWWLRELVNHTRVNPATRTKEPYPLAVVLEGKIDYQPPGRVLRFWHEPYPLYSKKRRDGFARYEDEVRHLMDGSDEEGD